MEEEFTEKGKPKLVEDLGMLYPKASSVTKRHFGIFECPYCGVLYKAQIFSVKVGESKSCGCLRALKNKSRKVHGLNKTRVHRIWTDMRNRCNNPNNTGFSKYGALGIAVCKEWDNFMSFKEWSDNNGYFDDLSIDRIDNDKGYSPDNCRWTTKAVQARNKRVIQVNNTSGYKGVRYRKDKDKYEAYINVFYNSIYLGVGKDPLELARKYDTYVVAHNLEHSLNGVLSKEEIEAIRKENKPINKN